ncbi:MAG: hypothetical protein Ct9H300mP11_25150 [Chloroflexota bacterium]|nr:MAG: hypothetical protein Ct9H300mP11_25150 [Chloroflexota bacterium]
MLSTLHRLGFISADDVRIGKYLMVNINESDSPKLGPTVTEMCQKLLANPVIENFQFEFEEMATTKVI